MKLAEFRIQRYNRAKIKLGDKLKLALHSEVRMR